MEESNLWGTLDAAYIWKLIIAFWLWSICRTLFVTLSYQLSPQALLYQASWNSFLRLLAVVSSLVLCWVQGFLVVSVWVYNDLFSGRIHKVRIWCRLYQCRNYQLVHPLWPNGRSWLIPCKITGTTTFLLEQVKLWRSGAFGVRAGSALEYRTCSSSRWGCGLQLQVGGREATAWKAE